jgi:hypothetical protein
MTKSPLKAGDVNGFMRAADDARRDLELTFDVVTTCVLLWTSRKGVLQLRIGAVELGGPDENPRHWNYSCEYPGASVATFEATLFQAYNRLYKVIDDAIGHPGGRA